MYVFRHCRKPDFPVLPKIFIYHRPSITRIIIVLCLENTESFTRIYPDFHSSFGGGHTVNLFWMEFKYVAVYSIYRFPTNKRYIGGTLYLERPYSSKYRKLLYLLRLAKATEWAGNSSNAS